MLNEVRKRTKRSWEHWSIVVSEKLRLQRKGCMKRTSIFVTTRNIVEKMLENIRKIGCEKICKVAREADEKEKKSRRKRLRRKWKKCCQNLKLQE
jgi:hypothetical protein